MQHLKINGEDGTMNNSVYYKATDEDGNIILRHAYNKKYQKGWKQNLDDNAARKKNEWKKNLDFNAKIIADKKAEAEKKKQNQQAREDYVRANRLKKVRKVIKEVKRLTKPGTPYKGPTSAHQEQQIQKDKERQKLAKELKNRKIAKQNQQAREDYVRANRLKKVRKVVREVNKLTKPGTPYKGPTSAFQAQQIQKDKERQKLAYKGPTSAFQAQQIQKDKERQKLAKELKNRKIAEQNRRAREKAANINRRQKAGKAYLNNLTK